MPVNGTIVNTARAEVVNYSEMLKALNERPDLTYISDVGLRDSSDFKIAVSNTIMATSGTSSTVNSNDYGNAGGKFNTNSNSDSMLDHDDDGASDYDDIAESISLSDMNC